MAALHLPDQTGVKFRPYRHDSAAQGSDKARDKVPTQLGFEGYGRYVPRSQLRRPRSPFRNCASSSRALSSRKPVEILA